MTKARIALLCLAAATGCATGSASWLAKVNEEVVTGRDLRAEFARHHYAMENILDTEPEVRKYLDRLVDRRLFVQEGYRLGLQDTPEVRDGVARYRAQKIVEAYVKVRVDDQLTVTEEELRAAHATMDRQVEALQLVVATEAEAREARAALDRGASFETLARERSLVPSAKRGGLILVGYGAEPALDQALAGLAEGATSAPFKANDGWEIVRLVQRREVERPPFDQISGSLRSVIQQRKRKELEQALYAPLWDHYHARLLDCAPTVEALQAAIAGGAATPCAAWDGGQLTVEALGRRVRLDQVGATGLPWPALRKAVLEDLVARELVLREAEAAGYGARPELQEKVRAHQDDQVESTLYRKYVVADVTVDEAAARAFHQAHPELFTEEAQYELAHVLVPTRPEAEEVHDRLVKGRQPFAEVAREFSRDPRSSGEGGRVGLVAKKVLIDEFAPVAALQEGEIGAPLQSKDGWHVVKVLSIRPTRLRPFEEVAGEARSLALEERRAAATRRWVEKLRAAATIRVSDAGIKAYSKETAAALAKDLEGKDRKGAPEAAGPGRPGPDTPAPGPAAPPPAR